jgi:NTE family protein
MSWQAVIAGSLCLSGCTAMQGHYGPSYRNLPDPGQSFITPKTAVPRATADWNADKPTFIGVAVSGGGARSANFGMAALAELENLGVIEHVDAISAVSGGSIPTAYFATHGTRGDWAKQGRKVASTDLVKPLIQKILNPANIARTTFTDRDRTDALAEVFEDQIFNGQRLTFADLGERGRYKPAVYFNATDTTRSGERFVFTDTGFLSSIGSDLSTYPLAWAMASSGAFPGIFNSVTLRQYSLNPTVRQNNAMGDHRYVHLIDGGPSDNLGVETLIELARTHHVNRLNAQQDVQGCMMIIVDSHVPNAGVTETRQSDRRNMASMLLDLNFLDAIDAMLSNRRDQTLGQLGIRKDLAQGQFDIELAAGLWEYKIRPYQRVSRFAVDYYHLDGHAFADARFVIRGNSVDFSGVRAPERRQFDCLAWHVALHDVQSIVPWKGGAVKPQPMDLRSEGDLKIYAQHARLSRVIRQIETNYRLKGPPNCTADQLQDAIYSAARIAVREDHESVTRICHWLKDRGLTDGVRCKPEFSEPLQNLPAIQAISVPRDLTVSEQDTDRFVMCSPSSTDGNTPGH